MEKFGGELVERFVGSTGGGLWVNWCRGLGVNWWRGLGVNWWRGLWG